MEAGEPRPDGDALSRATDLELMLAELNDRLATAKSILTDEKMEPQLRIQKTLDRLNAS